VEVSLTIIVPTLLTIGGDVSKAIAKVQIFC
jgi:hypothetical protein